MEVVFPAQFGDDFNSEFLDDWAEAHFDDENLGPIGERVKTLNAAIDGGWCPSRMVKSDLVHLSGVLTSYHLARYPAETLQTLDDAEAEFATWQTLPEAARDAIIEANERAEADLAARRKARQEAIARKNAIYEAARKIGMPLSPVMEDALAWVA